MCQLLSCQTSLSALSLCLCRKTEYEYWTLGAFYYFTCTCTRPSVCRFQITELNAKLTPRRAYAAWRLNRPHLLLQQAAGNQKASEEFIFLQITHMPHATCHTAGQLMLVDVSV